MILSSTEGQYLGPRDAIAPPYIADLLMFSAMMTFPVSPRKVIQHGSWAGCRVVLPLRRGSDQKCDHERLLFSYVEVSPNEGLSTQGERIKLPLPLRRP